VAPEMERQHGIAASIIPEQVWTRLYIKGMTPEQAASAPELQNYFTKDSGERLRKRFGGRTSSALPRGFLPRPNDASCETVGAGWPLRWKASRDHTGVPA
jgi:hypothetical protein